MLHIINIRNIINSFFNNPITLDIEKGKIDNELKEVSVYESLKEIIIHRFS